MDSREKTPDRKAPKIFPVKICLHVTSAAAVPAILAQGLIPQIGPLAEQLESFPGIYMFPNWDALDAASWLFDEAWPHDSEPALLSVDVRGLETDLEVEVGYEVITRKPIARERITVLAPGEMGWDVAEQLFYQQGGRKADLTQAEIVMAMQARGELP